MKTSATRQQRHWLSFPLLAVCLMLLGGKAVAQGDILIPTTPVPAKDAPALNTGTNATASPTTEAVPTTEQQEQADKEAIKMLRMEMPASAEGKQKMNDLIDRSKEEEVAPTTQRKTETEGTTPEEKAKYAEAKRTAEELARPATEPAVIPVANIHGEAVTEPN